MTGREPRRLRRGTLRLRCSLSHRSSRAIEKSHRVNEQIRISPIRVITDEGEQLGIIPTADALAKARETGLDLVEVAPDARPPVCKIMDFGKFKFQQKQKQKEKAETKRKARKVLWTFPAVVAQIYYARSIRTAEESLKRESQAKRHDA